MMSEKKSLPFSKTEPIMAVLAEEVKVKKELAFRVAARSFIFLFLIIIGQIFQGVFTALDYKFIQRYFFFLRHFISSLDVLAAHYMQIIGRNYPDCGYGGRFGAWIFDENPKP